MGDGQTFRPQLLAAALKAADILHLDETRIATMPVGEIEEKNLDRKELITFYARGSVKGWMPAGRYIMIQVRPRSVHGYSAFEESFSYMQKNEWACVKEILAHSGLPYQLRLEPPDYGATFRGKRSPIFFPEDAGGRPAEHEDGQSSSVPSSSGPESEKKTKGAEESQTAVIRILVNCTADWYALAFGDSVQTTRKIQDISPEFLDGKKPEYSSYITDGVIDPEPVGFQKAFSLRIKKVTNAFDPVRVQVEMEIKFLRAEGLCLRFGKGWGGSATTQIYDAGGRLLLTHVSLPGKEAGDWNEPALWIPRDVVLR